MHNSRLDKSDISIINILKWKNVGNYVEIAIESSDNSFNRNACTEINSDILPPIYCIQR